MKTGAMTLGAVIALTACASDPRTTATTAPPSTATTATTSAESATEPATTPATAVPINSTATATGAESDVALRMCVNALVDDPSAPGAHFVERVQELSVGYPMVEPLTAARDLCDEARAQLQAEPSAADPSAADLLAGMEAINAALDLAAEQIRMDAFYLGGSLPPLFIPDGVSALQRSIEAFYSQALVALS